MASGYPDYTQGVTTTLAEAGSFRGGADAAKPASPVSKDCYLATDTNILYICVADGSWTGFDASMLVQGTLTLYANMAANSKKITGLATPTAAGDGATKGYVDGIVYKATHSEPSRAKDTVYQNSTKVRIVTISCLLLTSWEADIQIGSANPPTTKVIGCGGAASIEANVSYTFVVPPNWYYRFLETGATAQFQEWHEWDLG